MTHPGNGEGFQLMGAVGMEQGKQAIEEFRAACRDCWGLGVQQGETPGKELTAV